MPKRSDLPGNIHPVRGGEGHGDRSAGKGQSLRRQLAHKVRAAIGSLGSGTGKESQCRSSENPHTLIWKAQGSGSSSATLSKSLWFAYLDNGVCPFHAEKGDILVKSHPKITVPDSMRLEWGRGTK